MRREAPPRNTTGRYSDCGWRKSRQRRSHWSSNKSATSNWAHRLAARPREKCSRIATTRTTKLIERRTRGPNSAADQKIAIGGTSERQLRKVVSGSRLSASHGGSISARMKPSYICDRPAREDQTRGDRGKSCVNGAATARTPSKMGPSDDAEEPERVAWSATTRMSVKPASCTIASDQWPCVVAPPKVSAMTKTDTAHHSPPDLGNALFVIRFSDYAPDVEKTRPRGGRAKSLGANQRKHGTAANVIRGRQGAGDAAADRQNQSRGHIVR